MKQDALQGIEKYTKAHQRKKRWYRVVTGLACVVVFCTVYALILPAITLEKGACEIPEHTHSEACYTQVTSATRAEPVCTSESLNLHQHDDTCYDSKGNLTCGYADFVVHQHDSACYDENGNLWCPLPEIETHEHTGSCYAVPKTDAPEVHTHTDDCYTMERGELICTESTEPAHVHTDDCYTETSDLVCEEDHEHTESCYETTRELTCGYTEEPAHQHTDQCYEQIKTLICDLPTEPVEEAEPAEPELICDKTEVILHEHTSDCFDDGNLICDKIQVLEHQHTDACFETVEEAVDTEALTCTLPEDENHTHTALCYGTWELTCGLEEHTHSEACKSTKPEQKPETEPGYNCGMEEHTHSETCYDEAGELTCGLEEHTHSEACQPAEMTEKEQTQVDEVIALIDALPASEEIEETAAAFEEAEDEDGLEAYLSELYPQVSAAYEAYSALTDAKKAKVTNADKLMELEWIRSAAVYATEFPVLTGDKARVSDITVTGISDGVTPWDANDNPGNDSGGSNKIVRTFDTVTYNFEVRMESYDSTSFSEARVKLEFVLPLTAEQAVFDRTAMAWMDQTTGYAPVLTTETRSINGVDTQCQVLTCYKRLLHSEGHNSVVPGTFGENVTVNVKSMKNGDTFAPIFSAAMEKGTWEGNCPTHHKQEKYSVKADEVKVSAKPKYNVQIGGSSSYKGTFDFNMGNSIAQGYGDGYGIGSVVGRVIRIGLTLQIYNDNASKGFKGIELPNGEPITFDISLDSSYNIKTPNPGEDVSVTKDYMPRLWSCDGNAWTGYGATNGDGRVLYDNRGFEERYAPRNQGDDIYSCYNGGSWIATQQGSTVHVTVSGYQINVDKMPTKNADTSGAYGPELGIGCFSAGELWIVQPYNKIGSTGANQGPKFDIVKDYGLGVFTTKIIAMNMKAKTVSGVSFQDPNGTNDAQTKKDDDRMSPTVGLTLPGTLQNRISYASAQDLNKGVGVDNQRDGLDFGPPGTSLYLKAGFSYSTGSEEDNILYWGTNLTKFHAGAIELTGGNVIKQFFSGARADMTVLYATKKDGTDWTNDWELLSTYEDALVFYKSVNEIPAGDKCVGLLYCFKGPGPKEASDPYYYGCVPAKIRDDMNLAGNTYMLASTSRVWTKSMFEGAGMTLDSIPDWTNPTTKLSSFPTGAYTSANIEGSGYYRKETYAADGSGALGTHNSDWCHLGDTLLVIVYKTGITKNLTQRSDTVVKDTYNLDANQRVVDFKLKPRTYYDQGSGNHDLTTTVTIVDTLPKHLTYRAGSSYFGGTYNQTSVNGGTQGTVTDGSLREPDSVVNNADGTQTLKWVISDVTVGTEMPTIYYSANIGDRNDPNQDVPEGTTHLLNKVRITATHDLRNPTIANGNYAESGIAVTRGTASSFGKYSKQTLVEPDGVIDYVVYYAINSAGSAAVVMLDTMPYNGVNGSHFTGSYSVNSWKLDVSQCDIGKLEFYYTMDDQYKNATTASLGGNEAAKTTIQSWTEAAIASDGTVTVMNGKQPVAWAIIGILDSNKSVNVDMQIKLNPDQSTVGNKIENNYYVNTLSSGETTITTENPTVNRTLEGLTWMDDSGDGLQNEDAARRISGVKVTLMKLKDGGDPSKEADYEPYHYQGNPSKPVVEIETGKIVSVRANNSADATAYEPGRYKFIDLPAGTFAVKFEDGSTTKILPFIASPANRGGSNDTIDSDGIATYNSDKSKLEKTVILDIDMPTADKMNVALYESKYHDSGFYERGYELPNTGGAGTVPYTMGGLLLLTGAAFLLLYNYTKRRKEDSVSL